MKKDDKRIFTSVDRNNNMNCVRYYLCLCILMNHYNVLTESSIPMLPRIFGGVGSFFAISGFLMFTSFEKHHDLKGYFKRRAKRILPPYVFIVLLSAFSLFLLSTYTAGEYFSSREFYKYLACNLCFMNFLQPSLPGVFGPESNFMASVNGSLWSMKGEVICYLLVPVIFRIIKKHADKATSILLTATGVCYIFYMGLFVFNMSQASGMAELLAKQFRILTFFFTGATINVQFVRFKKYKWYVLCFAVLLILAANANGYMFAAIRPFSDSILVIWCSMIGSWGKWASRHNTVSYDIYLFHFPIIQVLLACGMVSLYGSVPCLFLSIVLSVVLALFSWRFIDSRFLKKHVACDACKQTQQG